MAIMRLVPSTYYLSSTTYLSVSDADSMYDNTDSADYGTVTNKQTGTTIYYIYLRGFNFEDIPANATISSWRVLLKARETGIYSSSSSAHSSIHSCSSSNIGTSISSL